MRNINHKITILTDPIPVGSYFLTQNFRVLARRIRNFLRPPERKLNNSPYRGHFAVTRSLVEGLLQGGQPFNYNPKKLNELSETVIVLAGVRTLRQALDFKRKGIIKRLFAGPNIVTFSSDENSIIASEEIDYVITPCDWVIEMYLEDNPCLSDRIFSWPAGVDTEFWKPDTSCKKDQILIFEKQNKGPVGPVGPYSEYLLSRGYKVKIVEYGKYDHNTYLKELQKSMLMIGFVTDESQGLAWAEAWSCDVPTLIWYNTTNTFNGREYKCSTAPYLRDENGLYFQDFSDFRRVFDYWENNQERFRPRQWVLDNMSDEVCAADLYEKMMSC